MTSRRKISAAHSAFDGELARLLRLDSQNQLRFRAGPGAPGRSSITQSQMVVLTEGVFLSAFRAYEGFVEEVFVLFVLGKSTPSGAKATAYLQPRSAEHAMSMMQSAMQFLEWNTPDKVISRAELYLKDGEPVKSIIARHRTALNQMRWIRNRIAHQSGDAVSKYENVVRAALRTAPLKTPVPGAFLNMSDPRVAGQYFLTGYLETLRAVGRELAT